jgi:hypothetical protein
MIAKERIDDLYALVNRYFELRGSEMRATPEFIRSLPPLYGSTYTEQRGAQIARRFPRIDVE